MITTSSSQAYVLRPPASDTDAAQAKKARSQPLVRQAGDGRESKEPRHSRGPVDIFADLGDLPCMEGVHADIPLMELVYAVPVAWPKEVVIAHFPETREGKWHLVPRSKLLTPPTHELDGLRRALAERCVQRGGAKRKRDESADTSTGTPMAAGDFLPLVGPGSANLGAVVSGMTHQLVRDANPQEAVALGRDLARQLGGPVISASDLKVLVGTLMTVAQHVSHDVPAPEAGGAAQPSAPPTVQPLDLLVLMLRGACRAIATRHQEFPQALSAALREQACRQALAPVLAADPERPTPQHYAWYAAPLQLLVGVLDGREMAPRSMRWLVGALLAYLLPPDLPRDPQTQQARARHAQALLGSLGWLLGPGEPHHLRAPAITAVTREVARTLVDPRGLGVGLAQAFGAARSDAVDAEFLELAFGGDSVFTPRLGALAWGYLMVLPTPAGVQLAPFEALLRLAPTLKTAPLGLAAHYMALAGAQAQQWQVAPPKGSGGLIGMTVGICEHLDVPRQIALVCGVKRAVNRLAATAAGFQEGPGRMNEAVTAQYGMSLASGQAVRLGLAFAERPRQALALDKTAVPSDEWAGLLLVAMFASDQVSVSLLQDATLSLLEPQRPRGRSLWAMGIMIERAGEIMALPLMPQIRAFLVQCLQLALATATAAAGGSERREEGEGRAVAARTDTAVATTRYLQNLYRVMRPRLAADPGGRALIAAELEALQVPDLPQRARELLGPVVAELQRLLT